MCELFALSSHFPTTVDMSLEELARHGGETGPHADGFGIVFFEDRDVRLLRDQRAASDSEWVRFLSRVELEGDLVIAHVRKAIGGEVALRNTPPFSRELGGRMHAFAHNGFLDGLDAQPWSATRTYRPVGETDSERAFCILLERLTPLWETGKAPPVAARLAVVADFAADLRPLGPANFLYSDGDVLFIHGNRRTQADGAIAPPGLYLLQRTCAYGTAPADAGTQRVILAASVPLTDEPWRPLAEGEVLAVKAGRVLRTTSGRQGRETHVA